MTAWHGISQTTSNIQLVCCPTMLLANRKEEKVSVIMIASDICVWLDRTDNKTLTTTFLWPQICYLAIDNTGDAWYHVEQCSPVIITTRSQIVAHTSDSCLILNTSLSPQSMAQRFPVKYYSSLNQSGFTVKEIGYLVYTQTCCYFSDT